MSFEYLVNVSVDALVRLLNVASTEETRYYLNGVHVRTRHRTEGVILEATNGHCLAVENDDAGEIVGDGSYIVARWTIAAVDKAAKAQARLWKAKRENMRVCISSTGFYFTHKGSTGKSPVYGVAPQTSCFIDGSFPEIERVIPRVTAENLGTKDAYSAEQIAALSMSAPGECKFYVLYSPGIGHPALVRFSGALNWFGVVMPCRVDAGSTCHDPAWFSRPETKGETKAA